MRLSDRLAFVTGIGLFIGLMEAPTVASAVDLDRPAAIVSTSALRSDMPPDGLSATGWQRILAQVSQAEVAKLTASDAAAGDLFGISVSISGDTAVVGAYLNDDAGDGSGSAYVFERNAAGADSWGEVAKLTAPAAAAGDHFGVSVSISGDTVVVGADFNDDAGVSSGSAYVFERNTGGADRWGRVAKLTASDAAAGDLFGRSVSITGSTVVVGARDNDDVVQDSGSAYVFERNAGGADGWDQVAKLTASDAAPGDAFGTDVSISGDTVIVGAWEDDAPSLNSGSAYVFERNAGGPDSWGEVAKLTASDAAASDLFGTSVSISGDTVVVGAPENDDAGSLSGSAYVFERNAGGPDSWGEVAKLSASDTAPGDFFGQSVSISGDTVAVGAYLNDDAGNSSGSAYVFERDAGGADTWGEVAKLTASDAAASDFFGSSVSISGDTVVVGAFQNDDAGSSSGSAYIFTTLGCAWFQMAKPTASDTAAADLFGYSISISGDTVLVGAQNDDDAGSSSGSAYVFERNLGGPDSWGEVAKLIASDAAFADHFGVSVAASGDTVVVGASDNDDAGSLSGSAYVFERNTGGADLWGEVAELNASDAAAGDEFGQSVSISGDTVLVGAYRNDDAGTSSGSAYVFERNAGGADSWGEVAKLTASDAAASDEFGYAVWISGDTVAVGAYRNDDAGTDSGSAYVFARNKGGADSWGQVDKLTASDATANDLFGLSVSISGDTVVVGADQDDDAGLGSGSAYVFERNAGGLDGWGQVAKLTASDAGANDEFGQSVSISGDTVVVGAVFDNDAGLNSGSAYVFERNAGGADSWGEVDKLTAADAVASDFFGRSVSISEDAVVVGAYGTGDFFGSAYVFNCLDPAGDVDGDGVSNSGDCAVGNRGIWSVPGEARDLRLDHEEVSELTSLSWEAPLEPGGVSVRYDAVRSGTASDFTTSWFCVLGDGLGTAADDPDPSPIPPGGIYFYLVRGENDCGLGPAGADSQGVEREVHDCP